MNTIKTDAGLATAIKNGQEVIFLDAKLSKKVLRIRKVKSTAWIGVGGLLGAAIALAIATPATTAAGAAASAPAGGVGAISGAIPFTGSAVATAAAASVIGLKAALSAITIGAAAGGSGLAVVNKLRDRYEITKNNDGTITLRKKK